MNNVYPYKDKYINKYKRTTLGPLDYEADLKLVTAVLKGNAVELELLLSESIDDYDMNFVYSVYINYHHDENGLTRWYTFDDDTDNVLESYIDETNETNVHIDILNYDTITIESNGKMKSSRSARR